MFSPGKPPSRIMNAAAAMDPMPPPTMEAFLFFVIAVIWKIP
jgi:hypothetical protein